MTKASNATFRNHRSALLRATALAGGVIAGLVLQQTPATAQTVPGVPVLDAGNSFTTFQTSYRQFEWIGVADDDLGNAANYLGNYNYQNRGTATLLNPQPTITSIIPNVAPGPGWVKQELYITRTDQRITDYTGVFNGGQPRFSPAAFLSQMPTFHTDTYISTISVTNGGFNVDVGRSVNVGEFLILKSQPGVHPSTQNPLVLGGTVTADYRTYLQGSINTNGLVNTGTIQATGLYNYANAGRSEVFIQGTSEIGVRLVAQGNTDIIFQDINGGSNFTAKWTGRLDAATGKDIALRAGDGTLVYTGQSSVALESFRVQSGSLQIGDGGTAGQTPVDTGKTLTLDPGTRVVFDRSDDFSVGAIIAGAGGLTKKNTNVLTLTGVNTYTGATIVEAGTLKIGAGGALNSASLITVNSGATFDFGAINNPTVGSLGGTGGALTGGTGNLTVQMAIGATDTYAGTNPFGGFDRLVLSGNGTLNLTGDLNSNKAIAIAGGTLNLSGNNTLTGGIVVNGKLIIGATGATGGAGNTITTTGSVINYANGVTSATPININSNTTQLEVLNADSATQSGVISETTDVANPTRGFEKIGTGTLTLGAINTYSGATVISAGTLIVGSTFGGVTPTSALGTDSATNVVRLNGGTLQIDNQVATFARPVEITAANGAINNVANLTLNGTTTFTGLLSKTGAGSLILNGAGTGAGGLSVLAGGLQIGNASALGTGTLRMAGNTTLTASPNNVSVANAVILDGSVSVVTNNNTLSLTGPISGTGRLDKNNGGTLNLSGDNTFSGGFGLNAGTLGVGSNTALGTGQLNVATATTVQALGNVTLANAIRLGASAGFGTTAAVFDTGANTMTLNGVISGTPVGVEQTPYGITKAGTGTLVLNGANTYTGATVVNAGKLVVGGTGTTGASIASSSSLTVAAGATIGGNGATPTLTVNGTISPGNSVGVLNVNGGLVLGATSTTVIEIEGATADRINVTGNATLNGTLQLVAAGGTYAFATPYTILSATGTRSGTFATVSTSGSFGVGVTSAVSYGASNVQVTLTAAPLVIAPTATGSTTTTASTASTPVTVVTTPSTPVLGLSQTRNITAVAIGLDRAAAAGANVSPLFAVYNQPTREALAAAINSLSGEVHTATTAIGYRASDQFLRVMLDPYAIGRDGSFVGASGPAGFTADLPGRKGPVEAPRPMLIEPSYSIWAATFGATGRTEGDRRIVGSAERDLKDANIAVGADYRIARGTSVGFALSGGRSEAKLAGGMGSSEADIFQAGLYGASQIGALRLGASASYGSLQVQTRRQIAVLGQNVTADYRADVLGGRLQAAYEVFSANGISLSPFAALQVQSVHTPNFRETNTLTGAGAGVTGIGRTNTALRSELGIKAASVTSLVGRRLTVFAELGWGHDFLRDLTFAASLSPVPGASFVVAGARQERDAVLVAAGLDYQIAPNMTLSGRFDGTLAANSKTYAGSAALRLSF